MHTPTVEHTRIPKQKFRFCMHVYVQCEDYITQWNGPIRMGTINGCKVKLTRREDCKSNKRTNECTEKG